MNTYFAVLLALLTYKGIQAIPSLMQPFLARFEWRDYRLTFWGRPNERGGRTGHYIFDLRSREYRRKEQEEYLNRYV